MKNFLKMIDDLNVEAIDSVILYSGYHNNHSNHKFIPNSNFVWLTMIDLPNIYIFSTNNLIYYYYDYTDDWIDHDPVKSITKKNNISYLSYSQIVNKTLSSKKIYMLGNKKLYISYVYLDNISIKNYCKDKRSIKSYIEIEHIIKACEFTKQALIYSLGKFKHNNYNYCSYIINDYIYYLNKNDIDYLAFFPICTSGINNSIIHSNNYKKKFKKNDLLLLDVGCKFNFYCSDITRTIPISGRFTKLQLDIYNIVLEMNKIGISSSVAGRSIKYVEKKCRNILYQKLLDLKIILPVESKEDKNKITHMFMPHNITHSIGIDVHDILDFKVLKKNMVITIEPGIYFYSNHIDSNFINRNVWIKYKNIGGVRIEDVIVIKNKKSKVISNFVKEPNDIENLLLML